MPTNPPSSLLPSTIPAVNHHRIIIAIIIVITIVIYRQFGVYETIKAKFLQENQEQRRAAAAKLKQRGGYVGRVHLLAPPLSLL